MDKASFAAGWDVLLMDDLSLLTQAVTALFLIPLLDLKPTTKGLEREQRAALLLVADLLEMAAIGGVFHRSVFADILQNPRSTSRFYLAVQENIRRRSLFCLPPSVLTIQPEPRFLSLTGEVTWRKDLVALTAGLFRRRSRLESTLLFESQDIVMTTDSTVELAGIVMREAAYLYVFNGLRRFGALRPEVAYRMRGMPVKNGAVDFTLGSRFQSLLKSESKQIVSSREQLQVHEPYMEGLFFAPRDKESHPIHLAVCHVLQQRYSRRALLNAFMKALILDGVCYFPSGSAHRTFDSRTKASKGGVKMLSVQPVAIFQDVAEAPPPPPSTLFDTDLGAQPARFPEFTNVQAKAIDKLVKHSEKKKFLSKNPLLMAMIYQHGEWHKATCPRGVWAIKTRAAGFTKEDATGRLYLSRGDAGLKQAYKSILKNPAKLKMYSALVKNADMLRIIHDAKVAGNKLPRKGIRNFFHRFWKQQGLAVTGSTFPLTCLMFCCELIRCEQLKESWKRLPVPLRNLTKTQIPARPRPHRRATMATMRQPAQRMPLQHSPKLRARRGLTLPLRWMKTTKTTPQV